MKKLFKEMLDLQDIFNEKTISNWRYENLDWVNALFLEAAEQNESLAWKWWKHGKDDMNNFTVEVIDNWHFLMSLGMTKFSKSYLDKKYSDIWQEALDETNDANLQIATQFFCYNVLACKFEDNFEEKYDLSLYSIFLIMQTLELTVEDLYKQYITKNCLNIFRQDNGYKDGTYRKIWNGFEDNVVAFSLVTADDTLDSLYQKLSNTYNNKEY